MNLNCKERVKMYLENYPPLRDNDYKLISNIWHLESDELKINTRAEFLKAYASEQLTNAESIRRSRAVLQQKYKHLRGDLYEVRHSKASPAMVEELNEIKRTG